jgi:AraC family ethanolamine operon transcriptional activator
MMLQNETGTVAISVMIGDQPSSLAPTRTMTTQQDQKRLSEPVVKGEFSDFDQFWEAVGLWDMDWLQLDAGSLDAKVLQVQTPKAILTRSKYSRRLLQRGAGPTGVRTVGFLQRFSGGSRFCGREMTENSLGIFRQSGDFEAVSEPGFHVNTLSFREDYLLAVAEDLGVSHVRRLLEGSCRVAECGKPYLEDLRDHLDCLFQTATQNPASVFRKGVGDEIEFDLPAMIVLALASGESKPSVDAPPKRSKALRMALDYIDAVADEAPSVQEICRLTGVSWRTLDYAFRDHLRISPKRYLQAVRLKGARSALQRSGPDVKITDVANKWGFWHMGQFATDYRRQFGELPSETLQRHNGAGRRSETPANIASTQLLSP